MTLSEMSRASWLKSEASVYSMIRKPNLESFDQEEREELIGHLPDLKGKKVLELGAGVGRFSGYLAKQAAGLTAVDLVPQFIQKNRQDNADCPNVTFLVSDVMDIEFKEGFFDFIFINWLFMYLEDREVEGLLKKIGKWLSPKGELFFRESCDLKRSKWAMGDYFAHYRDPWFYESLVGKSFTLVKEGYIKTYVDHFGNPFHCFWHYQKG